MKDTLKIKYNETIRKWQVVKRINFHSTRNFEEVLYTNKDKVLCQLFKQQLKTNKIIKGNNNEK